MLVSPPIGDKQVKTVKDAETFGKTDVSVNGAITDDAFPAAISIEGSNIVTESKSISLKKYQDMLEYSALRTQKPSVNYTNCVEQAERGGR